ncbi:hypothetical protein [Paenibacillus sinopodophylli]|uniref:hypothetical protein n=1 Tax=Paenibacillus sinopodophylli TaxID=1837342 RepID=UPI00110D0079|nr:hypothetical protein [Paenibacillus sinopodophylli]
MAFQTEVNSELVINGQLFYIGEHPYAPGVPYGQEGRQGTVYLLHSEDRKQKKAFKVFRSKLANPSTVHLSSQISKFSAMDGLAACERKTITPHNNPDLLAQEPDLLYAVVMPWIDGPTWMDIVLNKQQLTRRQSYTAAFALAEILVTMEQRGLAHCDLSGPNLILPMLAEGRNQVKSSNFVQLIDLEQMFSIQFERPEYLPTGSPGYAPKYVNAQMWNAQSDRFSGAVILMEMLASSTSVFTQQAWGESYFEPGELQTFCGRYDHLLQAIKLIWGEGIVSLIQRAWESDELSQCPTFGEWLLELSKVDPSVMREDATVSMAHREQAPAAAVIRQEEKKVVSAGHRESAASPRASVPPKENALPDQVRYSQLMNKAKEYENKGNAAKAIETYRSIQSMNPRISVAKEIDMAIEQLQKQLLNRSKEKNKIAYGKLLKKTVQTIAAVVIIAGIGFGGYYAFNYFKSLSKEGPTVPNKAQAQVISEEVEQLKLEIASKDKTISELTEQVAELRKPLAQRSNELVQQLNTDFEEIKRLSEADANEDTELHQKIFEASEVYIKHYHRYFRNAYNLDEAALQQINTVEGYYFPFIYNRNRNAQLNYKFFIDYKENFKLED